MELKAPTPLGEKNTKSESTPKQQTVQQSVQEERTSPFKIKLPKIKINIIWLKALIAKIPEGKRRKILEISLIAVPSVLLIILGILIINFVTTEPYRMANTFLEKIDNGEINSAYEMTTDAYKAVNNMKTFRELSTKLNSVDISHPKIKSKKIEEIPGMGKYAYVEYKISGYLVQITVFNDSIDWGIHSVKLELLNK